MDGLLEIGRTFAQEYKRTPTKLKVKRPPEALLYLSLPAYGALLSRGRFLQSPLQSTCRGGKSTLALPITVQQRRTSAPILPCTCEGIDYLASWLDVSDAAGLGHLPCLCSSDSRCSGASFVTHIPSCLLCSCSGSQLYLACSLCICCWLGHSPSTPS